MNFLYIDIIIETKNQWARDDPAFVVILSFFLGGKNQLMIYLF
jgi:hypothetical protein